MGCQSRGHHSHAGTESNVKEIYDKCGELSRDKQNVILNQFSEFANYLIHYHCTAHAFRSRIPAPEVRSQKISVGGLCISIPDLPGRSPPAIGSKKLHGTKIAAVEAAECPTMLCNGYGEHNIQGIGDKHIPLIHNVMNTDVVIAVSDAASDSLNLLFRNEVGRRYLTARRKLDPRFGAPIRRQVGISGLANVVGAIKLAKHLDLGHDDVVMTVATDSAALYASESERFMSPDAIPRASTR